ncbi:hypothetical protein [Sphingomonas sp. ID0503]|jgi:hypothetical protein|uniref:hypothetical protein n=1 Tax=Sphingomonas sp. ID0503 TaxID=3399691 RepID=UPI003AFA3E22
MTPSDRLARRRFALLSLLKLAGLVMMALGALLGWGDILRPGGVPGVGIPILLAGTVLATLIPRSLAHRWRTERP